MEPTSKKVSGIVEEQFLAKGFYNQDAGGIRTDNPLPKRRLRCHCTAASIQLCKLIYKISIVCKNERS